MNKKYFSPEQDGFYGVYYPNPTPSRKAFIAKLGDSSDDRMVVSGVKWLQKRGCNVMAMSPTKKDYGHHADHRSHSVGLYYGRDKIC